MRRIPVVRLVEEHSIKESKVEKSIATVSFLKLENYVKEYYGLSRETITSEEPSIGIRLFYFDEEDEKIVISSSIELEEAIMTLHQTSNMNREDWVMDDFKSHEDRHRIPKQKKKKHFVLRLHAELFQEPFDKIASAGLKHISPAFHHMDKVPTNHGLSTKLPAGVIVIDTLFSIVANVLENFQNSKHDESCLDRRNISSKSIIGTNLSSFDPNFIHKRHTCDMCQVSPIVGYRYHSIEKANFDLCHRCFSDVCDNKTDGIDFTLFQMAQNRKFSFLL